METLRGEMHQEEWQSSHLMKVSAFTVLWVVGILTYCTEMLTPIDQPLDKLEDLTPSEM
jgi:hypothetical protein